jgi:hypothetical protein
MTTTTTIPSVANWCATCFALDFLALAVWLPWSTRWSELDNDRKWLTKAQMREAIAIWQSLPGPLAIQVGIYVSYLRGGFRLGRGLGFHPA